MRISTIFGYQSLIIHATVDIHIDIQTGIAMPGHTAIVVNVNIHE